jgi:hypothetical protein
VPDSRPVPPEITDEMILAAQNYDLAHRGETIACLWTAVPDKQVARLIAGVMPAIRAAEREVLAGRALRRIEPDPAAPGYNRAVYDLTAAEARIAELEQLATDMLERFRTHDGFAVSFCPSLAQFDRWEATLKGTP